MNVEHLGFQQQPNGSRVFERTRTEALLNSPSRQATRRTGTNDREASRARITFSALLMRAQQLQSRSQLLPSARISQGMSSHAEAAGPFPSFIAEFVAVNRIDDARALLAAVPSDQRIAGDLRAWSIALAEPQVRVRTEVVSDGRRDLDWLRRHASDYTGRWVALRDGVLVATAESLRQLLAMVDSAGGREGVLVHKV